jgi:hypothetical protein
VQEELEELYPSPDWDDIGFDLPDGENMSATKIVGHLKAQADRTAAIEFENTQTRMAIEAQKRQNDRMKADIELLEAAVEVIRADKRRKARLEKAKEAGQAQRSIRQLHLDGVVSRRILQSHNRVVISSAVRNQFNEELHGLRQIGHEMDFKRDHLVKISGASNMPMALGEAQRILNEAGADPSPTTHIRRGDEDDHLRGGVSGVVHDGWLMNPEWHPELRLQSSQPAQSQSSQWDATTAQ